tara:strand:+ start:373 stop:561 length:189 start_codon:yes stop_codon:yes gene_type:complete
MEIMKKSKKKIILDQKYRDWEKWLDECPVDWTSSRHPTSFIETINFDFTKYESEEEEDHENK